MRSAVHLITALVFAHTATPISAEPSAPMDVHHQTVDLVDSDAGVGIFTGEFLLAAAPMLANDCDDTDPYVNPGRAEIVGNLIDDNCNGLADEGPDGSPSLDTRDTDGDGVTLADGDCNDTNPSAHPGAPEIVGNRIDDNCNGIADEDASGNPPDDSGDHDGDGYTLRPDGIFLSGFDASG